jgi:hypothetical protein
VDVTTLDARFASVRDPQGQAEVLQGKVDVITPFEHTTVKAAASPEVRAAWWVLVS